MGASPQISTSIDSQLSSVGDKGRTIAPLPSGRMCRPYVPNPILPVAEEFDVRKSDKKTAKRIKLTEGDIRRPTEKPSGHGDGLSSPQKERKKARKMTAEERYELLSIIDKYRAH